MKQESIHGPKYISYWNVDAALLRALQYARFYNAEMLCEEVGCKFSKFRKEKI
jgi:hypothetical protein